MRSSDIKRICGDRSKFSTWFSVKLQHRQEYGAVVLPHLRGRRNVESLDQGDYEEDGDFRHLARLRAWQDDPEQCHSKSEIRQLVERGVLQLPAKYRVVVILRDIQQLPADEVSRQLGLSVPAVKTRLLRGRLMMRELLSPHFTASTKGAVQ